MFYETVPFFLEPFDFDFPCVYFMINCNHFNFGLTRKNNSIIRADIYLETDCESRRKNNK